MVGSGEKGFKKKDRSTYYLHHNHQQRRKQVITKRSHNIPKGCLAVNVGQGEEQQRIVVPVIYLNHPLFAQLLKEAEEEYGFAHQGTITIPCQVEEFRYIQGMIDREKSLHHHHLVACFKA